MLSENANGLTAADVAAVTGNSNNGWNGDGAWWLIVLFLFAFAGNGWGNGYGGNGVGSEMQRGFDTAAITSQLNGVQTSLTNGFANAEVANCGRAMDAMQTAYNTQIANMNQNFANAQAVDARLDSLAASIQNCCCAQSANTSDLKYTVATEACADRSAISNALRDVLEANNASTQRILDVMCQDRIDAKNEKIAELQQQLTMANLAASQNAQTATILANNEAQTAALEKYLNPVPIPAFPVNPPYQYNYGYGNTCGCGGVA